MPTIWPITMNSQRRHKFGKKNSSHRNSPFLRFLALNMGLLRLFWTSKNENLTFFSYIHQIWHVSHWVQCSTKYLRKVEKKHFCEFWGFFLTFFTPKSEKSENINCWLIIVKFIQLYTATSDIISRFRSVIGNHLQKNSHHLYIITWYLYWRGKLVNIFLIGTRQCQRWLKFNILHYIFSKGQ